MKCQRALVICGVINCLFSSPVTYADEETVARGIHAVRAFAAKGTVEMVNGAPKLGPVPRQITILELRQWRTVVMPDDAARIETEVDATRANRAAIAESLEEWRRIKTQVGMLQNMAASRRQPEPGADALGRAPDPMGTSDADVRTMGKLSDGVRLADAEVARLEQALKDIDRGVTTGPVRLVKIIPAQGARVEAELALRKSVLELGKARLVSFTVAKNLAKVGAKGGLLSLAVMAFVAGGQSESLAASAEADNAASRATDKNIVPAPIKFDSAKEKNRQPAR